MGQSLIEFAKSYGTATGKKQSLSDYAKSLSSAGLGKERGAEGVKASKASYDLSKPYGNAADWDGLNPKTAQKVLELQQAWGEPLQLNSTFRSKAKNKAVGGAKKSQHLHGNAVDISVRGMSFKKREQLLALASSLGFGGLGVYTNAIHVDTAARRGWGPSYGRASVPGWARGVIAKHEKNAFKGQAAEFARGELPGASTAEGGGREIATDMPLPERKGTATATGGTGKVATTRGGKAGDNIDVKSTKTVPGAPVTSPVGGKVAFVGPFRSWDNVVMVKSEDGTMTAIVGLQSGNVNVGDTVEAGQPIGVAGKETGVAGMKDGRKVDVSGLVGGLQTAGTEPVSQDSYGVGSAGMESESPAMGIMGGGLGGPTGGLNAPTGPSPDFSMGPSSSPALGSGPLSGDFGMGGMQGMGSPTAAPSYADAGLRGQPSPASQIARALQSPSMDSSLMGGAPAPQAPDVTMIDSVPADFDFDRAIQANKAELAALDAPSTPAFDRSYSSQDLGGLPGYSNEGTPDMPRYGHELGPVSTAFGAAPNISTTGLSSIDSANSYGFSAPAAPAMSAMTADFSSDLSAPSYGANLGALKGMGSPPSLMGLVSPIGDISMDDSYGFSPGQPSFGSEMSLASPTSAPSMSISDVSPAAASALGGQSQFAGIGAPDGMAYGGTGAFGGIGAPTADQAEAQANPGLSAAALSGTPANSIVGPTQKADAFAPGLRAFDAAFQGSVKSVGPKYSKAIAAALATPSIANQVAAVEASKAYTSMNGLRNNPEVLGLRSQQIGDFAMANPALGNALGLSMGQQGTGPLGGGIGGDPFGGGRMGGPVSSGAGGMGGMQGMGRASGPTGPGMGTMGGTIGGSSPSGGNMGMGGMSGMGGYGGPSSGSGGGSAGEGGQFSGGGPVGGGTQGNVIGNGNQGMGGMSMGGAAVTGRGPSSNPGSGAGLSAGQAAAIGAALSGQADAAAAAAASDAARGFGGYGGFGPSFSGGFF